MYIASTEKYLKNCLFMVDTIIFFSRCYIQHPGIYLPNSVVSSHSVVSHVNRSAICRSLAPRSFDGFSYMSISICKRIVYTDTYVHIYIYIYIHMY